MATLAELFWKSQNSYGQSQLLAKTIGRKQLVWDLRTSNAATQLGTPPHVLSGSHSPMWSWGGPYDVHILLPNNRELKTDALDITADIVGGKIESIHINGGTQLTPTEMRTKILQEVKTMRPNLRSDGQDGEAAVEQWIAKRGSRGDTVMWVVRGRPDITARVRDMYGPTYIVQYEFWWATP